MPNPLVSIITPCFNGENCIGRLIESVIAQTYRPLEFIIVNDGSTDQTQAVIDGYRQKLEDSGIRFICHEQPNMGLGAAINSGLKLFSGDYLCWSDSDDYYEPTSVEDRLDAFRAHPECAVVSSDAYIRDSEKENRVVGYVSDNLPESTQPGQFELLLDQKSIFCAGCHMVRTKDFLSVNPNREIYPARRGQNWQLLLPLYYKYDRCFLDKPLYNFILYPFSMSKDEDTLASKDLRYTEHETIILETLRQIERTQGVDLGEYKTRISKRYLNYKLYIGLKYRDDRYFDENYKKLRKLGPTPEDRLFRIIRLLHLQKWALR